MFGKFLLLLSTCYFYKDIISVPFFSHLYYLSFFFFSHELPFITRQAHWFLFCWVWRGQGWGPVLLVWSRLLQTSKFICPWHCYAQCSPTPPQLHQLPRLLLWSMTPLCPLQDCCDSIAWFLIALSTWSVPLVTTLRISVPTGSGYFLALTWCTFSASCCLSASWPPCCLSPAFLLVSVLALLNCLLSLWYTVLGTQPAPLGLTPSFFVALWKLYFSLGKFYEIKKKKKPRYHLIP